MLELVSIQFRGLAGGPVCIPLRRNGHPGTEIHTPEWKPGGATAAVAYVMADSPLPKTVAVTFRRPAGVAESTFEVFAEDASADVANLLGTVDRQTLVFAGAQSEQTVLMNLSGVRLGVCVALHRDSWRWKVHTPGSGVDTDVAFSDHLTFAVLAEPHSPWSAAFTTPERWVWVAALERACLWAAGAEDLHGACNAIADEWYNLGARPGNEKWQYTETNTYTNPNTQLKLGALLKALTGGAPQNRRMANCNDAAASISVLANCLGADITEAVTSPAGTATEFRNIQKLGAKEPVRADVSEHEVAVDQDQQDRLVWDGAFRLFEKNKAVAVHAMSMFGSGNQSYCARIWGNSGCTPLRMVPERAVVQYPEALRDWTGTGLLARGPSASAVEAPFFFHFFWSPDDLPGWKLEDQRIDAGEERLVEALWSRLDSPVHQLFIRVRELPGAADAGREFRRGSNEIRARRAQREEKDWYVHTDEEDRHALVQTGNLLCSFACPGKDNWPVSEALRRVHSILHGTRVATQEQAVRSAELPLTGQDGQPLWHRLSVPRGGMSRQGLRITLSLPAPDTEVSSVRIVEHQGGEKWTQRTAAL